MFLLPIYLSFVNFLFAFIDLFKKTAFCFLEFLYFSVFSLISALVFIIIFQRLDARF